MTVAWVLGCPGGEEACSVRLVGPGGWCASLAVHVACVVGNACGAGAWQLCVFGLQASPCPWGGRSARLTVPLERLVRDIRCASLAVHVASLVREVRCARGVGGPRG